MALKAIDLFENPGFDLTQPVDVVDFFNNRIVPKVNSIDPFVEQAQKDVDQSRQTVLESNRDTEQQILDSRSYQEMLFSGTETGVPSSPRFQSVDQTPAFEVAPSTLDVGDFRVFKGSRDQIKGFKSSPGARMISLDFNDAENKSARGIEIVLPRDASKSEIKAAEAYVRETHAFLKENGIDVPIRQNGRGVKIGGGKAGVIHTEPFFATNQAARDLLSTKSDEYAAILGRTLGRIPGSTFIAPHERGDQGAQSDKFSERAFALEYLIPALERVGSAGQRQPNRRESDLAEFAFLKELRTDKNGRLTIYNPPSSDKNSKEVAGFGNVTDPVQYKALSALIRSGKHEEAKSQAKEFLMEGAGDAIAGVRDPGVAGVAIGVLHHRGKAGFRSVLDKLGVEDASSLSGISKDRWVRARAQQERENEVDVWKSQGRPGTLESFRRQRQRQLGGPIKVGNLGLFPKGLYNRWKEEAEKLS